MVDRIEVMDALERCNSYGMCDDEGCPYYPSVGCLELLRKYALALLKEQANEYENGFNDAMLGKQELMYEGTDGKWHKKDW